MARWESGLVNTRTQNNRVMAVGQWNPLEEAGEWGITRAGQHAASMERIWLENPAVSSLSDSWIREENELNCGVRRRKGVGLLNQYL